MHLLTSSNSISLWHALVRDAEDQCSVTLKEELEAYLVSLLARYTDKPEVAKQIFATAFLDALNLRENQRMLSLRHVGDGCLLLAGLFPHAANRRLVKINYFVELGRAAYSGISDKANDLYGSLALEFVVLMDVLQSIQKPELLPLEAYEQWNELGSQRALKILQEYSNALPLKGFKR